MAVVVPAYNEAAGIGATLQALAAQSDRDFDLVVVDNGSSDRTADIVRATCGRLGMGVRVVPEPLKGTGAASDTGIRAAIAAGATHVLRTDADTLPARDWVAAGRSAFSAGADLVTGPMRARTDEVALRVWERVSLPAIIGFCQAFGRFRPSNRGPEFAGPYRMSPGCNLGVSASAYLAAGGFPRTAIEDVHEDRELVNRVRQISRRVEFHRDLAVRASVRRLRAYGLLGTLRWYLDHGITPDVVDVRSTPETSARAFAATDAGTRSEARLLRAAHPVVASVIDAVLSHRTAIRIPLLGVLVADPVGVRRALTDGEHFAKSGPGSSGALWTPVLGDRVLLNMDGAEHQALRRRLADLFSPRTVGGVVAETTVPLVEQARTALLSGASVDVCTLARDVSAAAIARIVGIPSTPESRATILAASDAIESLVTWRTRALSRGQAEAARRQLRPIMDAAGAAHDQGMTDSVMGRLRADGVSRDEARSLAAALLLTGVGTVSAAAPRIVGQLADAGCLAPGQTPTDAGAVVQEGLRMTTPSPATLRRCTADTEISGRPLRAGDRAVLLLWWATRLEGGFDPTRAVPADRRHLWFGAGSHFCLGAPLALAELEAMTAMLLDVATVHGLVVTERTAARRVLVPRYARLTVRAVSVRHDGHEAPTKGAGPP